MTDMSAMHDAVGNGKRWLFLSSRLPWTGPAPAACADLLLTAAVFGQQVTLAFIGDGVLQLQSGQDGSGAGQKTLAKQFPAYGMYDVQRICADAAALQQHGLTPADLVIPVAALDNRQLRDLVADSDVVFQF